MDYCLDSDWQERHRIAEMRREWVLGLWNSTQSNVSTDHLSGVADPGITIKANLDPFFTDKGGCFDPAGFINLHVAVNPEALAPIPKVVRWLQEYCGSGIQHNLLPISQPELFIGRSKIPHAGHLIGIIICCDSRRSRHDDRSHWRAARRQRHERRQ